MSRRDLAVYTLASVLSLGVAGSAVGQERSDTTMLTELPVHGVVRFLATSQSSEWQYGTVTTTRNPTCAAIRPAEGNGVYLLVAVDSVRLRVVVAADTIWRPIDVAAILARDPWCSPPRPGAGVKPPSERPTLTSRDR